MLELILFAVGILGFGAAAYFDLRYTEFADWLPYGMIILVLAIRTIFSIFTGNFLILTNSIIFGLLFLGLGFLLYFTKQWGDGDAWLLGVLGFLFPDKESMIFFHGYGSIIPFYLTLIFNLFLVSLFYIVAYSLVLGAKNKSVRKEFSLSLKRSKKGVLGLSATVLVAVLIWTLYFVYFQSTYSFLLFPFYSAVGLIYLLYFFSKYAKAIEKKAFTKKIPTSKLKVGDVLVSDKWRGLTKKDIQKLRKTKKFVEIKEGIRFAPVFLITVLVTALYGGLLFL